jgi:hypothetical protein
MHDDYRGYDPSHYLDPIAHRPPTGGHIPGLRANVMLSAADLRRIFGLLNSMDLAKVRFSGTLAFDGHSFAVGFDTDADAHFITFS